MPSGKNASDHGDDRPVVTVITASCVVDLRAGASVWPEKAAFGFTIEAGVCSSAVKLLGGDAAAAAGAAAAATLDKAKPDSVAAAIATYEPNRFTMLSPFYA